MRSLVSRAQGGRSFTGGPPVGVVANYATLFIDRVPDELTEEHMKRVIEGLRGVGAEALARVSPAASSAASIGVLSRVACRLLPGCDEDTVSAEVAKRLGTTVEGAHAWMIRPFIVGQLGRISPTRNVGLRILAASAEAACAESGSAAELRRWYTSAPTVGSKVEQRLLSKQYLRANRAINKGCKE